MSALLIQMLFVSSAGLIALSVASVYAVRVVARLLEIGRTQ